VEGSETAQPLLLFTKRLVCTLQLIRKRPAEKPDDQKGQAIDAEGLERLGSAEASLRQPSPHLSQPVELNVGESPEKNDADAGGQKPHARRGTRLATVTLMT